MDVLQVFAHFIQLSRRKFIKYSQVVDTNATSLVTPRLAFTSECLAPESEDCTDSPCLNGGRCVKLSTGQR